MTAKPTILPCPFCGGAATVEECSVGGYATFSVGCNEDDGSVMCMGYQSLSTYPTPREAIEAWNRRALK